MYRKLLIFKKFTIVLFTILIFFLNNISAFAFNSSAKIHIYSSSDTETRSEIDILNLKNTNYINFYIDKFTWDKLNISDKYKISDFASLLGSEFEYQIYPKMIKVLPNISQWLNFQDKLTIILTPMVNGVQGYIRQNDFSKNEISNEGNIIYLNSRNILNSDFSNNILYSFFAHEFMHLISFREKTMIYNIKEDTWLEELRSEYLPHYLGYNQNKDSYLNFRLKNGVGLTDINLTNWNNSNNSYTLINLFGIYLNQRFNSSIIFDTLTSNLSGVDSINLFLNQKKYKERFSDIYRDWIIANILNDCTVNSNYCYNNLDVQINIPGASFFLPLNNDSALSISDSLSNYQTKYQKIVGGSDNLEIILENTKNNIFQKIPYILISKTGPKILKFFNFNNEIVEHVNISDYSKQYSNIIIIPMFATNNDNTTQLFKWHINSSKILETSTTLKPTTTTSKPITTTSSTLKKSNPNFGNSSPIIINFVSSTNTIPWYTQITNVFKNFFSKIKSFF